MYSEDDRPVYSVRDEDTSSSNHDATAGTVTLAHPLQSSSNFVTVALAADRFGTISTVDRKPAASVAECGLFQRLWTDDDEIEAMYSEDDPPVYSDPDDEVSEDDDDDTSSSNHDATARTVTLAEPLQSSSNFVTVALAADQAHRFGTVSTVDRKPAASVSERGLFQRLWTDDDEIEVLRGFLEHTSRRGGAHDAMAFYDEIKSRLELEFNKNQLVEKLRRLKKKFRTIMGKLNSGKEYAFKSPHEQAMFEISKKIWTEPATTRIIEEDDLRPNSNVLSFHPNHHNGVDLNLKGSVTPMKRPRLVKSEEVPLFSQAIPQVATPVNQVPGLIEETVRSCLTPIIKELVQSASGGSSRGFGGINGFGGFGGASPMGFNFGMPGPLGYIGGCDMSNTMDEKWRKQQLLELEVYSKRLALVQDQINSAMDDLRSKGS